MHFHGQHGDFDVPGFVGQSSANEHVKTNWNTHNGWHHDFFTIELPVSFGSHVVPGQDVWCGPLRQCVVQDGAVVAVPKKKRT